LFVRMTPLILNRHQDQAGSVSVKALLRFVGKVEYPLLRRHHGP
jgi:hypothetical protein